ncbi:MAG TPA: hypothetical protein VI141_09345 [Acidimicrobiia bacterium]
MNTEHDQMAVLRRLRSEGRIDQEEFDDLVAGLHSPGVITTEDRDPTDVVEPESAQTDPPEPSSPDDQAPAEMEGDAPEPLLPPRLKQGLTPNHLGGHLLAVLALFVVGALGMLSWWVIIPAILVLATTLFQGWGHVTAIGALVVVGLMLMSLVAGAGSAPAAEPAPVATAPLANPYPPIPGSLGIYVDQVPDLWNTVDASPRIIKSLTRNSETGEYDTFLYRFGEWGRVAGAYDPETEAIYGLLVTGHLDGEATHQLYLNACFLVAPFSPECFDAYNQQGLAGGTLEDFRDTTHQAEWMLGDHTWRLEVDQNVLTIRVFGSDAA